MDTSMDGNIVYVAVCGRLLACLCVQVCDRMCTVVYWRKRESTNAGRHAPNSCACNSVTRTPSTCMQQPEHLQYVFDCWLRTCVHACISVTYAVALHSATTAECVLCSPSCCPPSSLTSARSCQMAQTSSINSTHASINCKWYICADWRAAVYIMTT